MNTAHNRIHSFDFMRIIAACAVVMIHIAADFIAENDRSSMDFVIGNAFCSISRFAVPMFIMISGALMLDENKKITVRKINASSLHFFILTLLWSLLYTIGYNIIRPLVFHEEIIPSDVLDTLFNGHYHMWYLFALIGLYLTTPLLRCICKQDNAGLVRNYLLLSVVICFGISFINELINQYSVHQNILSEYIENYRLTFISENFTYYVLGWYIVNIGFSKKARIALYISGLVGLVLTFVFTNLFYDAEKSNYFYSNGSLNVFVFSVALFVFIHSLFESKHLKLNPFLSKLSSLTFGVYLIHCVYLFATKLLFDSIASTTLEILVTFISSILLTFATAFVLSKIPILKKLIRG